MLRDISKQKTKEEVTTGNTKTMKRNISLVKSHTVKVVDQTIIKPIESLNKIQVVKLTYVYTE